MSDSARREMLRRIEADLESLVLVGGQAVDVWASAYAARSGLGDDYRIASKDVDFATSSPAGVGAGGVRAVIERVRAALDGRVYFATMDDHTVSFGKVVFTDADGHERAIDFMESPFGLKRRDLVRHCVPVRVGDAEAGVDLYVMHPVHTMLSRAYNVVTLAAQYRNPRGLEQLRTSILCARAYLEALLDAEPVAGRARAREVLRWNERVAEFCAEDLVGRQVFGVTGFDPFDAVLVDARLGDAFVTRRYPMMRATARARRR